MGERVDAYGSGESLTTKIDNGMDSLGFRWQAQPLHGCQAILTRPR